MSADRTLLTEGDRAPAFSLQNQDAEPVELSDFAGAPVLVYFYPRADTPGCTTQACGLRDVAGDIGDTAIVGISPDTPDKLARFAEKHDLGFTLLSDPDHEVIEAYGAWGERNMYGRKFMGVIRSAVLVDAEGRVAKVWGKISPKKTPEELVRALQTLEV